MSRLAITSIVLGLVIIAARLPGVLAPARFREVIMKFPRSLFWGRALMAIVSVWAGLVLYQTATEDWAWTRPLIVIGVPVAYWLVIRFADQFLAIRAAAALTLLLAKVILEAAGTSDLELRLVVTVFAYLCVVAAIWMAIAPHQVRDWMALMFANDPRCRAACTLGVAIGAVFLALGLFVY